MMMNDKRYNTPNGKVLSAKSFSVKTLSKRVEGGQRAFRAVLEAMSNPGKIVRIHGLETPPSPLNKVSAAICMSLVDFEMPLWIDTDIASNGQAVNYLRLQCDCPITSNATQARTALISDGQSATGLDRFFIGTDERPDLSATIIVQVQELSNEGRIRLYGPGIKDTRWMNVEGIAEEFWDAFDENHGHFPCGLDVILSTNDKIVCLPRTIKIEF